MNTKNNNSLKDIQNIEKLFAACMENARAALKGWFKMDVRLSLSEVVNIPYNEVPALAGKIDEVVVAVLSRITGEIEASQLFIYPKEDAGMIVNLALNRSLENSVKWDELERSILEETSNILGSAFVNALVKETDLKVVHDPPVFGRDMLGSLMQSVLVKYAKGNDGALLVKSDFQAKDLHEVLKRPLKIFFFILPDKECFLHLQKELRG